MPDFTLLGFEAPYHAMLMNRLSNSSRRAYKCWYLHPNDCELDECVMDSSVWSLNKVPSGMFTVPRPRLSWRPLSY